MPDTAPNTEIPVLPGHVAFVNRSAKDIKTIKIGFDWPAFFSPLIFGIPHLIRKMWVWGGVFLVLRIALEFFQFSPNLTSDDVTILGIIDLIFSIGFGIWLGKNGRAQFAKSLLGQGYELAHPTDEQTKAAKLAWGML